MTGLSYPHITYRWWERLHYRVLGYWPDSVVQRRLAASDDYRAECMRRWGY